VRRIGDFFEDARDLYDRLAGRPLRPRILRPNGWSMARAEAAIRLASVEWAYVFDANGSQIGRSRGNAFTVTIDPRLLAQIGIPSAAAADGTLVHNHPPNLHFPSTSSLRQASPPSDDDVRLIVDNDLAALVLITEDWRYVVARPQGGWYGDGGLYVERLSATRETLLQEFATDALAEVGSEEARYLLVQHRACVRLGRDGWWGYRRQAWAEERPR
jgi:hypothetical protein